MTQALGVDGVKSGLKTVLVSFDDHQAPAFEVERLADGRVGMTAAWSVRISAMPLLHAQLPTRDHRGARDGTVAHG